MAQDKPPLNVEEQYLLNFLNEVPGRLPITLKMLLTAYGPESSSPLVAALFSLIRRNLVGVYKIDVMQELLYVVTDLGKRILVIQQGYDP